VQQQRAAPYHAHLCVSSHRKIWASNDAAIDRLNGVRGKRPACETAPINGEVAASQCWGNTARIIGVNKY